MKKLLLAMVLMFAVSAMFAQSNKVEISFNYAYQKGFASNQFALWIEDAEGGYIKTLFATKWTAAGGWKRRENSLPLWVKRSSLAEMNKTQIDALSGATPKTGGILNFTWDGTNNAGKQLPDGEYKIFIEGTLRNEYSVLYTLPVKLSEKHAAETLVDVQGKYSGTGKGEQNMISKVTVRYLE